MKWLKRSFSILALALAFSTTALAGETGSNWTNKHDMRGGIPARIKELEKRVAELEAQLKALEPLLALVEYVSVDEENTINNLMPPHVFLTGANLHILSGAGQTDITTGKGNLIIGYNEADEPYIHERNGSHNLVVGPEHSYPSYGGFVAGYGNIVSGISASVSGGVVNSASGIRSSISGGHYNSATGHASSISGGVGNEATQTYATVSGGVENAAKGFRSHVSGGFGNEATGENSNVSGGLTNKASGLESSVSGGQNITCSADYGWAAGTSADTCP